jgi:hypothetical protein
MVTKTFPSRDGVSLLRDVVTWSDSPVMNMPD